MQKRHGSEKRNHQNICQPIGTGDQNWQYVNDSTAKAAKKKQAVIGMSRKVAITKACADVNFGLANLSSAASVMGSITSGSKACGS